MITVPTPAEFLLSTDPDEEEYAHGGDPLDLLVDLERRVIALEAERGGQPVPAVLEAAACTECERSRAEAIDLANVYDEAGSRAEAAEALVEQIEGIVKKSTSQVSLAVKAAIEAWRNPVAEPESEDAPDGHISKAERDQMLSGEGSAPLVEPAVQCEACARWFADAELFGRHNCAMSRNAPAADADVSEWRTYARGLGYTGPDVDAMNRSQIRTMLGIEQPVAPGGPA